MGDDLIATDLSVCLIASRMRQRSLMIFGLCKVENINEATAQRQRWKCSASLNGVPLLCLPMMVPRGCGSSIGMMMVWLPQKSQVQIAPDQFHMARDVHPAARPSVVSYCDGDRCFQTITCAIPSSTRSAAWLSLRHPLFPLLTHQRVVAVDLACKPCPANRDIF